MRGKGLLLLAASFLLLSCAGPIPVGDPSARFYLGPARPLENTISRWTRTQKLYRDLETIMILDALFRHPEVRQAMAEYLASSRGLSQEKARALKEKEAEEAREELEFILAVYTGRREWNDFHLKGSVWRLFLEDDRGRRVEPTSIRRLKLFQKASPLLSIYRFVTPWKETYSVSFPRDGLNLAKGRGIKLVITGLLGRVELRWKDAG
ncbi:MAG: hypothetical protein ACE5LX_03730 [Nitrospinota bacterium]